MAQPFALRLRHPAGKFALTALFLDESRSRDYPEGCPSTFAAVAAAMPCSAAAFHWPLRCGALRLFGLLLALIALGLSGAPHARAITIQFDYSFDTLGFFGTAQNPTPARTTLEFAARTFTPFTDSLPAIQPNGSNSWAAKFDAPLPWDKEFSVPQLHVPQDTLVVFALAGDLAESIIGQASPGYASYSGDPLFKQSIINRGQGNASFDFAAWGGFIAVDIQNSGGIPRNWHYNVNAEVPLGAYDFYTTVTHELAHLFGFGISTAFSADIVNNSFTGSNAQALYGGSVPLTSNNQHWASNVTSPPFRPGTQPKPSLGPFLPLGERKLFTPLDYAALADIGWQVPPELLRLPADFNGDAVVDGADFLTWQRGYGGFGGTPGDANGDLFVDDYDGWIVRNYLGSQGLISEALAAVPEPTAATLALVVGLAVVSRLRYRRRGFAQ